MKRIATYIDTGVLIAGWSGEAAQRFNVNFRLFANPHRFFVGSDFLLLETLPKAIYHKNKAEIAFYERFFNLTQNWMKVTNNLMLKAFDEASRNGLRALDALHVVAAHSIGADELITTEKPTKPIYRTNLITVTNLLDI